MCFRDGDCEELLSITTKEACVGEGGTENEEREGVGCYLPTSRVLLGVEEEECRNREGQCSTECEKPSCRSQLGGGRCVWESCLEGGGEWEDCRLEGVEEGDCVGDVEWVTCEGVDLGVCGDVSFEMQVEMDCYLDRKRGTCEGREECEKKGGECSDLNQDTRRMFFFF